MEWRVWDGCLGGEDWDGITVGMRLEQRDWTYGRGHLEGRLVSADAIQVDRYPGSEGTGRDSPT